MKWLIPGLWLASILFVHFRGRVRLPLSRQFLDHSVLLAPINAFMVLCSRVPTTPYLTSREIPELQALDDNWEMIRDEALKMAELRRIRAADRHDDIGFNSFFKYGWKRFYLKWYEARHPSAEELCPKTVALLKSLPKVKAAMFAELPAGGKLNAHRDPFAGSLRYHLGLATPNDDRCYIVVDGDRYSWRDGESVVFDETYVHEAHNKSEGNRIILFCDVERPLRWRWAEAVNHWFGRKVMSAASSPNDSSDQTGAINKLTHLHWKLDQKRKQFKAWNKTAYKAAKWGLIILVIAAFLAW
ncbi:lipid A hydroxylase LpxO [Bordetella avium]|uniref:LpxO2 n=1 Tax=Bordetella avium TaxID=521 RepID=U3PX29_BORAV|nr:lipid A hydroxylase LpxO [Bordetella avium]AGW82169.1 LpxO2 [Bordetella avium]AZY49541.1 lipid A hydroxylase LpxO [Bordetella avium]AZY52937.1 lipid A hydroxylase LpxO [Bordetella avium]RIQ11934.1 lipid A hydroxylase LpxO [Bordetella avium]RIQ37033.1 lipid A hydroxylase LpxO [Bordetella avium]